MLIYVLDDGETWTINDPTPVLVTDDELTRLEGGEKLYHIIPDWHDQPTINCSCMSCTRTRTQTRLIVQAQNQTQDK